MTRSDWGDYHLTYPDTPTDPDMLVAPESAPLHPLSWLAIPVMLIVVAVALVALVVPALPWLLR